MNFFKNKVQKYQEKKLLEAKQKVKFHTDLKNRIEEEMKNFGENPSQEIKEELEKQKEFIQIWEKNVTAITKQLKKLNS